MKGFLGCALIGVFILVFASSGAMALSLSPQSDWLSRDGFEWCPDTVPDRSGGFAFETYGIGAKLVGSTLVVIVETNFNPTAPLGPNVGTDSYSGTVFSPGDLYINVGACFQDGADDTGETTGGSIFGIATLDRAGNVLSDNASNPDRPSVNAWHGVTEGNLYGVGPAAERMFATGTYEGYGTVDPPDGGDDPYGGDNNYPTLIRNGVDLASTSSGVKAVYSGGSAPKYQIQYTVDIADIGLSKGEEFQLFWAMECGNDGAEWKGDVPEPSTMILIGAGLVAMAHKKRILHI